ncbi:MAG: hypothetical protein KAI74_00585 [Kiritimatiellae bacterium]|nr:hypothetical protein [Kiritimatiellia bacterium]
MATIQPSFAPVLILLVLAPFCAVRFLLPQTKLAVTIALTAILMVIINTIVPIIMHITGTAISSSSLTTTHIMLSVVAYLSIRLRKIPLLPPRDLADKKLLLIISGFALIILPFTPLTGIDTYKWLDLATSMKAEQSIAWLVHPLSLLGFTGGRSYPSAQPLILGTIMTSSNLNVEWSFYFMSLLSGILGISSAYLLAQKCFHTHSHTHTPHLTNTPALWTAFFYGFAPVFMRYNHWATGRGLFIAIFPLFLLTIINLSKTEISRLKKGRITFIILNALSFIVLALFLTLSHKAGLIALLMILVSLPITILLPRRNLKWLVPTITIAALAIAIAIAPNKILPMPFGLIIGFAYTALTRFGWLIPLAAVGLLLAPGWTNNPHLRRLLPALLLAIPLSCTKEMYGALIALIFICLAATKGFIWLNAQNPTKTALLKHVTITMIIIGAFSIIIQRSITATPRRIRAAALFLEQYDPDGPFQIKSSKWRTKIQGYVSGCPRFAIKRTGNIEAHINRPPTLSGSPAKTLAAWTSYSRHIISVSGFSTSYYGKNPRHYTIQIDQINQPPNSTSIYAKDGIEIFIPINQHIPASNKTLTHPITLAREAESEK